MNIYPAVDFFTLGYKKPWESNNAVLVELVITVNHLEEPVSEEPVLRADLTGPCCKSCTEPLEKYYSVDHGLFHAPFCGETCLDPSKYNLYKLFEPNLTKAVDFPENTCAHQYTPDGRFYAAYNSTVTHGVPGVLSVTLDLYGPL
jgi:hypothetical protein